jgi:hypothetical protein
MIVVMKQKGAVPMKTRSALVVLAACLVAMAPLAASEAVWEVIVPTGLQPSSLVLPNPLPAPALVPLELLAAEPAASPIPQIVAPPRIRSFSPAGGSGPSLFDANLALMVGLNVADYFATKKALKYPGMEETNPFMRPFVKSPVAFAAIKFGTTALTYVSFKAIFKRNKTVAWVMTTATNCLLSYVVANNVRLIQAAKVH